MSRPTGIPDSVRPFARHAALALLVLMVMLALPSARGRFDTTPPLPHAPDSVPTPEGSSAALHRHVTFERGEEPTASTQFVDDHGLTTTDETARAGERAGVALLREDDGQYRGRLGYRAEWQSDFYAYPGTEYWYGASYYLPDDWDQGENDFFNDRIIFQFHEGTGSSPAFSLHLRADPEEFFVRRRQDEGGFQYLWAAPFEVERWYDFVFHVNWTQGDDGFFDIYLDGALVSRYEGPTLVDGPRIYTKWGIYGQPTRLLFDEVRIATGADGLQAASPPSPS